MQQAVRLFSSLAFVPVRQVGRLFVQVVQSIRNLFRTFPRFRDFVIYFRKVYIGYTDDFGQFHAARYPPEDWTQFERARNGLPRSDGSLEGFHFGVKALLGQHLPLASFADRLANQQQRMEHLLYRMQSGQNALRGQNADYARLDQEILNLVQTAAVRNLYDVQYLERIGNAFRRLGPNYENGEIDEDNDDDDA